MNLHLFPWVEVAVFLPLIGTILVQFVRQTETAWGIALAVTALSFLAGILAWVTLQSGGSLPENHLSQIILGQPLLTVDSLSAPLLPLVSLLHFLTILTTARVKMNRMSFTGHLAGESIRLATFACISPWPLIGLLVLGALPPLLELRWRRKPFRVFLLHMLLFAVLLITGWAGQSAGRAWAPPVLLLAVLIRSGTFPMHLWVADLFRNATFGTAILFATPLTGVYAALRLAVPVAPTWVLEGIGFASLFTVVYTAGLAVVQTDTRRFFACLFLSHSAMVLIGLELHNASSMAGALGLWLAATVALTGLGLVLRSLEARYGPRPLSEFHGFYEQTPELAVAFLIMGLSCVGFPGTLGFIAAEVLVDGILGANPIIGLAVVTATALNGIAIVRAYLYLFTGKRQCSTVPLTTTYRERWAVLLLMAMILGGGMAPQILLDNRRQSAIVLGLVSPATISANSHP